MTRFFAFLCAVVIALSANAVPQLRKIQSMTKDGLVATKVAKGYPIKTFYKNILAPKLVTKSIPNSANAADTNFTITVADITYNSAYVSVEATNTNATFYWNIMDEATYLNVLAGAFAQDGINDLCDYFQYNLDYTIQLYAQYGITITYDDLLSLGVGTFEYEFENLNAETSYVVVAIYMDENGCTGNATTYPFTTSAFELSGVEVNFVTVETYVQNDYHYRVFEIAAYGADDNVFDIRFYVQEGFVGSYTEEDIESGKLYIPTGVDYEQIEVLLADFVINETANLGEYVLTGDFTLTNGDIYHVTLTFVTHSFEYDETNGVTRVYDSTNAIFAISSENDYLFYVVDANNGADELALYLFPSALNADGYCIDGVYPINNSMSPGTCYASLGFDGQYIYPSYYAMLDVNGYISNVWFLVSGNVTISNNGRNIAVDALNSNGATVKYTYSRVSSLTVLPSDINAGTVTKTTNGQNLANVVISAIAYYGYHFTQWSDSVTDNPRTVVLTSDSVIVAEFERDTYSVNASSTNGVVEGGGKYLYLDAATLIAIPDTNYIFLRWSDGNTQNPRTIQVTGDMNISAIFRGRDCIVSVESNIGEEVVNRTLVYGTTDYIFARDSYGYHFRQWGDGVIDNPRLIQVEGDATYTAIYERNHYTIGVSADAIMGDVTGSGTYLYLDTITITATSNTGFQFNQWSDGNTDNPRQVVITCDTMFTAEFGIKQCQLILSVNNDAWGIVSGDGMFDYKTAVTCTATAMSGYEFVKWSDGSTYNPYQFIIFDSVELTAEFAEIGQGIYQNKLDKAPEKLVVDGILYIRRGDKLYDVQGRMLK